MEKKPIVKTLRNMKVGDVVHFPLSQYSCVSNARYRDLYMERADGYKWTVSPDLQKKLTVVTRVS